MQHGAVGLTAGRRPWRVPQLPHGRGRGAPRQVRVLAQVLPVAPTRQHTRQAHAGPGCHATALGAVLGRGRSAGAVPASVGPQGQAVALRAWPATQRTGAIACFARDCTDAQYPT